ncbi:MAG: amidohydrolase family protein [Pirellulales bacterium]
MRRTRCRNSCKAGISVALGTDGRCTNPDLDLLAEIRHVAGVCPSLEPARVLQLGTLDGARALGLADECGSLSAGKRADFLVFADDRSVDPCALLFAAPALQSVYHRGRCVTSIAATGG